MTVSLQLLNHVYSIKYVLLWRAWCTHSTLFSLPPNRWGEVPPNFLLKVWWFSIETLMNCGLDQQFPNWGSGLLEGGCKVMNWRGKEEKNHSKFILDPENSRWQSNLTVRSIQWPFWSFQSIDKIFISRWSFPDVIKTDVWISVPMSTSCPCWLKSLD